MNCPKCHKTMREVACIASGSTLHREAQTGLYSGLTCWNCGTWIDTELQIRKPMMKLEPKKHIAGGRPSDIMGEKIRSALVANFDKIAEMRRTGVTWKAIKSRLGLPGAESTTRRHYLDMIGVERG